MIMAFGSVLKLATQFLITVAPPEEQIKMVTLCLYIPSLDESRMPERTVSQAAVPLKANSVFLLTLTNDIMSPIP